MGQLKELLASLVPLMALLLLSLLLFAILMLTSTSKAKALNVAFPRLQILSVVHGR